MSGKTHPVYIDEDRKNLVKSEGAANGISMKEVMQRLVEHGLDLRLHEVPPDADVDEYLRELTDEEISKLTPMSEEELEEALDDV